MRQTEENLNKVTLPVTSAFPAPAPAPAIHISAAAADTAPSTTHYPESTADATATAAARWPGGVMVDKLGRFETTVASLTRTVERLAHERNNDKDEIVGLKAEIKAVNKRLAERGVDLKTERKMDMWKQRVDGHLDTLGRQLASTQAEREGAKANAQALTSVMDEFRSFKAEARRETDQFATMFSELRSSIIEMQGELASQASHFRMVSQRSDEATDEVRVASTRQRHDKRVVERLADEIERLQGEVRAVRAASNHRPSSTHDGGGRNGGGGGGGGGRRLLVDEEQPPSSYASPMHGRSRTGGGNRGAHSGSGNGGGGGAVTVSTPNNAMLQVPEVVSFETLKRRWALRREQDADESTLDSFDLTLDASRIIRRGAPRVDLIADTSANNSFIEPITPVKQRGAE
jgi:predicted  nucleic acid-binding Zn-ribbon protein